MTQSPSLPELPEPRDISDNRWGYDADDMQNYGLACYEAGSAAAAQAAKWRSLCDSEWINIVNNPKVLFASDKEEAVAEAFKLIEAKLRELNDAAPTQGAEGAAPQAEADDNRTFGLTLECVGRAVEVTFNREQISALVERLRAFGLLTPSPTPTAPHQPTNREDAEAGDVNAIRHVAYSEGYRAGKAAASAAPQEADALREAAQVAIDVLDHYMHGGSEFRKPAVRAINALSAALAQHQPQQGEQHG